MKFLGAVLKETGKPLQLESLALKNISSDDVVIKIRATSLCHTDLEAIEGALGTPLPFIPGHEAAGIVEEIGTNVKSVKVGDHVVISWNPYCKTCYFCQRKQPIICDQYRKNVVSSFHFDGNPRVYLENSPVHQLMYAGSFAQYAVVTEECAVKIPDEIPFEIACLIGCGVMTGVGAVLNIAKVSPGSTVGVIGCGAVGLSAIQGALIAGARKIVAIDRDPKKLEFSKQFGVTDIVLADENVLSTLMSITDGIGLDYIIESAGNEAAFQLSVETVRPGGQVVWLGKVPTQQKVNFRWGSLMGEKKIHRSSYGGATPQLDFPYIAQCYLDGKIKLDEYVTSKIQLHEINEGFERLKHGQEIRSVIQFE